MFDPFFDPTGSGNQTVNTARARFEVPKGIQAVFTDTVAAPLPSGGVQHAAAFTFWHATSSLSPTKVNENLVFVDSYSPFSNFGTIPHEVGQSLNLVHVLSPLNLMCGTIGSPFDFVAQLCTTTLAVGLNSTQIRTAQAAAKLWE